MLPCQPQVLQVKIQVIEVGLIWVRNCCPGSDTRVECHEWTVLCGAGDSGSYPGGTSIFGPLPLRGDSLETKNERRWGVRVKGGIGQHLKIFILSEYVLLWVN